MKRFVFALVAVATLLASAGSASADRWRNRDYYYRPRGNVEFSVGRGGYYYVPNRVYYEPSYYYDPSYRYDSDHYYYVDPDDGYYYRARPRFRFRIGF